MPQRVPTVNEELPPHSVDRMPTLTEVLELAPHAEAAESVESTEASGLVHDEAAFPGAELAGGPALEPSAVPASEPALDTRLLVNEVLAELQPRIDMLFESRLREALAPALARAAEGLIREARGELGSALHELVNDAVQRALQRRGGRW